MSLNEIQKELLQRIFIGNSKNDPAVSPARFRADNVGVIAELDELERKKEFLERERSGSKDRYQIWIWALPYLELKKANELLSDIELLFDYLRQRYSKNLVETIQLDVISDELKKTRERVEQCVFYLNHLSVLGGWSTDLTVKNAYVVTCEELLSDENFSGLLNRWTNIAIKQDLEQKKLKKTHGNTEVNAKKREEILGAAIAVLVAYPEKCRTKGGKVQGSKIKDVIEEKAPIWWEEKGEPPLKSNEISKLINRYISSLRKV